MVRKPKNTPMPEDFMEQTLFPPSRAERNQRIRDIVTVVLAFVILGLGIYLRYTVFAERFAPKPMAPVSTPTAAPSVQTVPLTTPSPEPSASPSVEPVSPSLLETNGQPIIPGR